MRAAALSAAAAALALPSPAAACAAAQFGGPAPDDETHRSAGVAVGKPDPSGIDKGNNAFHSKSLLREPPPFTGETPLHEVLRLLAEERKEELCYASWQPLPPPTTKLQRLPVVSDGSKDQDLEWVVALGMTAVARLHSLINPGGPVVGAMCALGSEITKRRCKIGTERLDAFPDGCDAPLTNQTLPWPMAVSIWKVGHEDLPAAVTNWRANDSMHIPMISWAMGGGQADSGPWNGGKGIPMASGNVNPPGMPHAPHYPGSKIAPWGESTEMMAKVVPCSQIPAKFRYHTEEYDCRHVPKGASQSSVDEWYAEWKQLVSLWPPTSATPAPPAPLSARYQCRVCEHVYDAASDGGGEAFADLPDSWVCPVCGAPKAVYTPVSVGDGSTVWAHKA